MIVGVLTNALQGCSSEKGSDLYTTYSSNTPGGSGTDSAAGGVRSQASGGTGGVIPSVGSMPSGGRPGSVNPPDTGAGAENTGGADDGAGGDVGSETGGVGQESGGASSAGGSTSSGGVASGAGGSSSGGSSSGGASSGGSTAAGGGPAACQPAGAERCDGRDENCTAGIADESCPESCIGMSHGAHGYMFCRVSASRAEANNACVQAGLSLARIDSAEENAWVRQTATSLEMSAVWLGGRDAMEGVWRWVDGAQFWMGGASGVKVGGLYSNWQSGQPNNNGGNQDCLRLGTDALWDDVACADTYSGFICRGD